MRLEAGVDVNNTRANIDAFVSWLDSVKLTKPVTLADKTELMTLVKSALQIPHASVEVYAQHDPDEIFLRIEWPGNLITRTFRAA